MNLILIMLMASVYTAVAELLTKWGKVCTTSLSITYVKVYGVFIIRQQRGQEGKGVVSTTMVSTTLYDDYLYLVTSNKQRIQWTSIQGNPQKFWITGNS